MVGLPIKIRDFPLLCFDSCRVETSHLATAELNFTVRFNTVPISIRLALDCSIVSGWMQTKIQFMDDVPIWFSKWGWSNLYINIYIHIATIYLYIYISIYIYVRSCKWLSECLKTGWCPVLLVILEIYPPFRSLSAPHWQPMFTKWDLSRAMIIVQFWMLINLAPHTGDCYFTHIWRFEIHGGTPKSSIFRDVFPPNQWKFQDPKMEVLYHIRPYFGAISPYIALT